MSRAYAPHCDQAVLHAPGECQYCDEYPDWQEYRIVAQIAFTGHEPEGQQVRCPAEQRRPINTINRWYGNVPHKHEEPNPFDN
jgi:hypothetical protein